MTQELDAGDLEGAELDAAVARALGMRHEIRGSQEAIPPIGDEPYVVAYEPGRDKRSTDGVLFSPSSEWDDGGPIIERERISPCAPVVDGEPWRAVIGSLTPIHAFGSTPLIAAMRAFVASKSVNSSTT